MARWLSARATRRGRSGQHAWSATANATDAAPALWAVCAILLAVFLTQNMFLVLLPISLTASGLATGTIVGLLVAASEGLGILLTPPAASYGDQHGHGRVLKVGGLVTALGALGLAFATVSHSIWLWVAPVFAYALARTPIMVSALTIVNGMPQPLRIQGINGAVQRAAAILGALLAALLIAWGKWHWGFGSLTLIAIALYAFARKIPTSNTPTRWQRPRHSYAASLQLLRTQRALQASSMVNLTNRAVIVLGNAFFPLSVGVGNTDLAKWVLLFLASRDLTSVACGFTFRPLVERFGLRGAHALMTASSVSGLLVIGLTTTTVITVTLGAALQGVSVFIAIGSANLLATLGGRADGRALRLTSTFYVVSVASLAFPAAFGTVLDTWGGPAVFVAGAGFVAVTMTLVILMIDRRSATTLIPGDGSPDE
jgi:hypothetical protein